MATTTQNILAGISFPFRAQGKGLPTAAKGTDVVKSALIVLIRTKQRSRVMRPTIGMLLHTLIFEDNGPVLQSLITREIISQVGLQLPQVDIFDIEYSPPSDQNDHKVTVNVKYMIQGVMDQTGNVPVG